MIINDNWPGFIRECQQVSLKPAFLNTRWQAESEARNLLNQKAGFFEVNDLITLLDLCNTEIVPPDQYSTVLRNKETRTRFQLSFIGQNRKLMIRSLESANEWIGILWNSIGDPYKQLANFWNINEVPGAGIGLPTMILYLKDPDEFNVWLGFLNDGFNQFSGSNLSSIRNASNYHVYNNRVNKELRQRFDLAPQETDYILYRIKALNSNGLMPKNLPKNH